MAEILTIEQVAELLQCDPDTAAVQFNAGQLPGVKFGRRWVIPAQAFHERLHVLALEQAAERRAALERERERAAAAVKGAALLVQGTQPAARGRKRRPLPQLPTLPTAMHNQGSP
ncbi:helix-turn-helix domain-containing protein [Acidovorax radicis]|jgi:excisionase family DNA binding protein|nr:helix-turn-helix domain-containing protein [Acidovorax radicis]